MFEGVIMTQYGILPKSASVDPKEGLGLLWLSGKFPICERFGFVA